MAIYIPLERIFEDDERAEYKFGKDEKHYGTLAIDKLSGEVSILEKAFMKIKRLLHNEQFVKLN